MKKTKGIYTIKLKNWEQHNPGLKKSHKKSLISHDFCYDTKLSVLPMTHRWLFLGLILECGSHASDTIEMSERQLRVLLESSRSVARALDSLQSLQLLSYALNDSLLNRKEEKGKEEKGKEMNGSSSSPKADPPLQPQKVSKSLSVSESDLNKRIWESYLDAYRLRYKVDPTRNVTVNTQISNLRKRLGEDAVAVIAFYLSSNHVYYVGKCHPVGLCLVDAESLHTQWKRGKALTRADVNDFEKTDKHQQLLKSIREEGI